MTPPEKYAIGMGGEHFDEMTCLLYLDGQLDSERAADLLKHADACSACGTLLAALENESRLLHSALVEEDEAVPARLLEPDAQDSVPWGWLTGLGFAGAAAYTVWTQFLDPWRQQFGMAGFDEQNLLSMLFFSGVFWKGWDTVMTLVNILAAGTLGALFFLLRRRSRLRVPTVASVFGSLLLLLALPAPATAMEIKKESYTLPAGETVKGDLIVHAHGGSVRIDGTVDGDLIVFCVNLTVRGHVTGDIIAFSMNSRIEGQVDGNIRAFNRFFILDGTVAKNATLFTMESINLDSKTQVGGSLISFSRYLDSDGRLGRDVLSFFDRGRINGFIGGSAMMHGERLAIGSGAEIQGPVKFQGVTAPEVSSQAKLAAGTVQFDKVVRKPLYMEGRFYWHGALKVGAALVFGIILILLLPEFMRDTTKSAGRFEASFGAGALAFIATPILALVAGITVVGLGAAIVTILLWAVGLYAAQVFLGAWIGERILGPSTSTGARIGRLLLGLIIIRVLWNLPYGINVVAFFVVSLWGMGAMAYTLYKRFRPEPVYVPLEPPAAASAPGASA